MEDVIRFVLRHRVISTILIVTTILVAWFISFFISNSLVLLTVTSEALDPGSTVKVSVDDQPITDVASGETSLVTVPRGSSYITVSTDQYSTLTNLEVPLFIGSQSIELKPHQATSLADTSGNNCYYQRDSSVLSWQCDQLDVNVRQTNYPSDSFPMQSSLDLSNQHFQYATRYQDGFLALSGLDGADIQYADFSQPEPEITPLKLGEDFNYETMQIMVDTENSDNFLVLDRESLKYRFYQSNISSPSQTGSLPDDFRVEPDTSASFTLEDSVLTYYSGSSTDDVDSHSGEAGEIKPGKIISYSLTEGVVTSQQSTDKLLCSNAVVADDILACIDRSAVNFYQLDNLDKSLLSLSNSHQVFEYDNSIYVSQNSSIYKYDADSNSLHAAFKVADRSIASSYILDGTLYISAWYTYPDDRQRTLAYQVDLAKSAKNPSIIKAFPFDISTDMAYGTDVHDGKIYVYLIDNNDQNQSKVRQILGKDLLDDYRLVFN